VKSIAITILLTLLFTVHLNSQVQVDSTQRQPWFWCVSAPNFGFIVPHNKQMTHLIQGHSYGFHTSVMKKLNTLPWHMAYHSPEHGFDFTYINTGNKKQLGQQLAFSYLLNLPLNRQKETEQSPSYRHWLGLGIGVGYTTVIWDLRDNHKAAVIGSHLNSALTLQYSVRIKQWSHGELRSGLRITHFSNGAFQIPNLGTNNAGIFLSYLFHDKSDAINNSTIPKPSKTDYEDSYRFTVFAGAGLKEIQPPIRKKYPAYTFSALLEKRVSYKSSIGLGADLFNNTSLKTVQERLSHTEVSNADIIQMGIALSYSLLFRDFELKMQQGFYLYDQFNLDGKLYNRFGLRYRLNEHWFAQLTLKTHFAKADYAEWGFGYAF
jgi:hypothetical protein